MTQVILASTSAVRRELLAGAGLAFTAVGSGVDEEAVKARMLADGARPRAIAEALAAIKAEQVSRDFDGLVIGADQTLDLDGTLFDKVVDIEAARERLLRLRGRTHQLHAGVAVAQAGAVVWMQTVSASLTVRAFSDGFLDTYLARNGEAALTSVGCYHLEGEGVQLFEKVEGDYFAILGLPLQGLLDLFRARGVLAA
ncbi:MAG: Maf family protein [Caulobacteraceae bacterium]|nr:Maf family protein [Caulobacteraceae bacterium]